MWLSTLLTLLCLDFFKASCTAVARGRGLRGAVGGASASQFGLVHAAHQFLQFDGERHVTFDPQLPRHEGHRRLQLT